MKIFLTGGSGFIGKNFIKLALSEQHVIYAVTRKKRKNEKNLIWLKGKLDKNWKELKNSDILVHLASSGVTNQNNSLKSCMKSNVFLPFQLLLNSIRHGCKNWIIVGTSSEFGETLKKKQKLNINSKRKPNNNYGLSKYIFSELVFSLTKIFDVKCRYARLFPVYGDNDKKNKLYNSFKISIKKRKKFFLKKPNEIRDYSNVENIAEKLLEMTDFSSIIGNLEKWHLASGNPEKLKEFVYGIIKESDKHLILVNKKKMTNENHISDTKSLWT